MLSAVAKQHHRIALDGDTTNEIDRLNATIQVVFAQLKIIKMQSEHGYILNEVLERTEVLAYKARNNPLLINSDYMRSYQKNVWQLLKKLDLEETDNSSKSTVMEKYKRTFYELFSIMDESLANLVSPQKQKDYSSLVLAM